MPSWWKLVHGAFQKVCGGLTVHIPQSIIAATGVNQEAFCGPNRSFGTLLREMPSKLLPNTEGQLAFDIETLVQFLQYHALQHGFSVSQLDGGRNRTVPMRPLSWSAGDGNHRQIIVPLASVPEHDGPCSYR